MLAHAFLAIMRIQDLLLSQLLQDLLQLYAAGIMSNKETAQAFRREPRLVALGTKLGNEKTRTESTTTNRPLQREVGLFNHWLLPWIRFRQAIQHESFGQ